MTINAPRNIRAKDCMAVAPPEKFAPPTIAQADELGIGPMRAAEFCRMDAARPERLAAAAHFRPIRPSWKAAFGAGESVADGHQLP
jgi:hypothetical protein